MTTACLIYESRCPKCLRLAALTYAMNRVGLLPVLALLFFSAVVPSGNLTPVLAIVFGALMFAGAARIAVGYLHPFSLSAVPLRTAQADLLPFGEGAHGSRHPGDSRPWGTSRVCLECPGAPVYRVALPGLEHVTHRSLPHNFYLLEGSSLHDGRRALWRLLIRLL